MIVRCPECETSFNLPADKIPEKGSKVRCSKCSHTFRVRPTDDGGLEVFHKNEGVADPPTQDLSDHLFDSDLDDDLDDAFALTATSHDEPPEEEEEEELNSTLMGRPASTAAASPFKSKSASEGYNPFPHAKLEPEMANTSGIDLFDDDDDEPAPAAAVHDEDPFGDAFAEEPEPSFQEAAPSAPAAAVLQPQAGPRGGVAAAPAAAAPALAPAPAAAPEEDPFDAPLSGAFLGETESEFGPADELVDPSFGEDTPHFDPNAGVVHQTPAAAPAPSARAARRPAAAPPVAQARPAPAPAPVSADVDDDWDVAPHKIGGGGFQKVMNFFFIVMLVLVGFVGVIAAQSGGVVDFTRFDHMLDVAFQGKEFEARKEWIKAPPPPPKKEEPKLVSHDVFASLVSVGRNDAVLVVNGTLKNETDSAIEDAKVRVMILDANEKILRESTTKAGRTVAAEAIAGLETAADANALAFSPPRSVPANGHLPFMALFTDVPKAVRENHKLTYRVEIVAP